MRRSRKARQADERQLAFTLAVEAAVTTSPGRTPAPKKPPGPKDDHPVPYVVRGIFRFSSGRERECCVCAVSPSYEAYPGASEQLITRMRESGWQFTEGNALLTELLETRVCAPQPITAVRATRDRVRAGRSHASQDEGGTG